MYLAISRRVATWLPNDWTEVNLPLAIHADQSRLGPMQTLLR